MRQILLLAVALIACFGAKAYDYPYLTFVGADNAEVSLSVENLEITVSDGSLVAVNADGTKYFTLAQLSKMYFSTGFDGVEMQVADGDDAVEVYSILGIQAGKFSNISDAESSLKPGLYIVKNGVKTRKLIVK